MQQEQQKATVKQWGGFQPGDVQTLPLKPGVYDAALVRIETIETRFGEKYRLKWDIRHGGEIRVINELCDMNNSADGKFMKRIAAVNGVRQLPADVDLSMIRTSAHVTTIHRVDMTKVAKLRERHKAQFLAAYGFGLTYLPFVTRAAVAGLRQHPLLNASLDNNNIIYHNEIHVGIAVALDNGLIVPVIRGADEKNVLGLQRSIVDLAARARSRQLKPDEVTGGTFSITNFGSFGSLTGTPVINQPQVAIMGVGTVDKTPVVIEDAIAIRSICHLSLSFDHRLIDGALADQFMTKVKQVLENWSEEVL